MGPTRCVGKPGELLGNPVLEHGVHELEVCLQRILHVFVTEVLARFPGIPSLTVSGSYRPGMVEIQKTAGMAVISRWKSRHPQSCRFPRHAGACPQDQGERCSHP
jgi:hypothetical protein